MTFGKALGFYNLNANTKIANDSINIISILGIISLPSCSILLLMVWQGVEHAYNSIISWFETSLKIM